MDCINTGIVFLSVLTSVDLEEEHICLGLCCWAANSAPTCLLGNSIQDSVRFSL